jgi:hypothetical protein
MIHKGTGLHEERAPREQEIDNAAKSFWEALKKCCPGIQSTPVDGEPKPYR